MAKIVIIDDETGMLEMMSQLARRMGHETSRIRRGAKGCRPSIPCGRS